MNNGLNNNTKPWYKSVTIWLLVAQLGNIMAAVISKEMTIAPAISLAILTISGFINRYYTSKSITFTNGK